MMISVVRDDDRFDFVEVNDGRFEEQYKRFESNGVDEAEWQLYHTVKFLQKEDVERFVGMLEEIGFEKEGF